MHGGVWGVTVERKAGDPYGTWGDYFHAECNWWGGVDGPYDLTQPPPFGTGPPDYNPNPDPNAEPVSDWFHCRDESDNDPYRLQEPALTATSCKGWRMIPVLLTMVLLLSPMAAHPQPLALPVWRQSTGPA